MKVTKSEGPDLFIDIWSPVGSEEAKDQKSVDVSIIFFPPTIESVGFSPESVVL